MQFPRRKYSRHVIPIPQIQDFPTVTRNKTRVGGLALDWGWRKRKRHVFSGSGVMTDRGDISGRAKYRETIPTIPHSFPLRKLSRWIESTRSLRHSYFVSISFLIDVRRFSSSQSHDDTRYSNLTRSMIS